MLKTIRKSNFALKNSPKSPYIARKALEALKEMNRISELNGNSEMTLEEINAEIYAARREMEAQQEK